MITLDEIEIEGFGGFAKTFRFNLKQPGLNILNSRNGSRKTTIFSAMCWVLYGKSLKPKSQIETWEDKRPKDWKGTRVSLYFTDGEEKHVVHRCIKYRGRLLGASGASRLIICDSQDEISFKDKHKAQQWIVKKLGMTFELFKNTVVFGQKMKRFIEEDGPTKKEIFEEIFDTSYIQVAKKLAEEQRDQTQKDLTVLRFEYDKTGIKIEALKELNQSLEQNLKDFNKIQTRDLRRQRAYRTELRNDISKLMGNFGPDLNKTLKRAKRSLDQLHEQGKQVQTWENDEFRLDLTLKQDEATYDGSKREQQRLVKELAAKHYKCSLCKQKLSPGHQLEHSKQLKQWIADEKAKREKLLPTITKNKAKHEKLLSDIKKNKVNAANLTHLEDWVSDIKDAIKRVAHLEKEKKEALKEIHKIKAEKPDTVKLEKVKSDLQAMERRRIPMEEAMNKLEMKLEDLNWVIKDPLSNSGIKAYIFSQMIKKVNHKLVSYGHIMNGLINFGIDLSTGNRDFYITIKQGSHLRFYPDFSGGEQQLVNICIAFAMYDTISENNPFNLLILDEVFEGLDDENVEIVGDLVKVKSKGRSLFVITHKRTFIPNGSNLINL